METPKFTLLSDGLMTISQYAKENRIPVLSNWLNKWLADIDFQNGIFDEEALIDRVQQMLGDTEKFCFPPKILAELQAYHKYIVAIKEQRQIYLAFALNCQLTRLAQKLANLPRDNLEKRKRNMERGRQKVQEELEQLCYNDKKIEEIFDARISIAINKRVKGKKTIIRNRLNTDYPLESIVADITAELVEEKGKILHSMQKEGSAKIEKYLKTIEDLDDQLAILEIQIKLQKKLRNLLDHTKTRLAELEKANPKQEQLLPAQPSVFSSATNVSAPAQKQVPIPINNSPPLPKKAPSSVAPLPKQNGTQNGHHKKSNGNKNDQSPDLNNGKSSSNTAELSKETDYQRLLALVALANTEGNGIRILVPRQKHKYQGEWENLLITLGFKGKVFCVVYKDLNRTNDFTSPVIVPSKMNTHDPWWNRKAFNNLVVVEQSSPNLLHTIIKQKITNNSPVT